VRLGQTSWVSDEDGAPSPPALAIGVDIGGTKIAAGVVSDAGKILERHVVPTPADEAGAIVDLICGTIERLRARYDVKAAGIGAPGWVEWPEGRIRFSPYIAINDLPLRQLVQDAAGLPVVVDNDANAAAWAESQFGMGKGVPNMLLLTIGTGIGGAVILGGDVYRGTNSLGAEVGHIIIDPGGELCGCGNRGCFETRASGTAMGREARKLVTSDPDSRLAEFADVPGAVTGHAVTRAAKAGDESAREILRQIGFWCGIGIASLVAVLDPALVVITGGMAECGELLLAPMRTSLEQHVYARDYRCPPPIAVSPLGPDAGLIGAGALALHTLEALRA
jgi:glucokinase